MSQLYVVVTVDESYKVVLQKKKENVPKHVQLHY